MSDTSSLLDSSYTIKGYSTTEWSIFVLYIIIAILAIIGNSFVIFVIMKRKQSSLTFLLIANQAASDLLCGVVFISIWFFCSSKVINLGLIGIKSCEVAMVLKMSTFFVSAITMTLVSRERYRSTCHPETKSMGPLTMILIIWLAGLLIAFWTLLNMQINEFFTEDRLFGCRRSFVIESPFTHSKYNFVFTFLLVGVLPINIMGFYYYKVIRRLREDSNDDYYTQTKEDMKETKQLTKMLILIVVFYFLLGSPVYLMILIDSFSISILPDNCGAGVSQPAYYMVSYWMAASSNCINPFIYCKYGPEFREELKMLFCRQEVVERIAEDHSEDKDYMEQDPAYDYVTNIEVIHARKDLSTFF
ncbi:Substance-K receptor [Halotydeus destructor]|nr:Substance-K receptor [Halotydeus destructor]